MLLRIGTSSDAKGAAAVTAAARRALAGAASPALGLVFATPGYPPEAVAEAASRELGGIPWAGVVTHAILVGRSVISNGVAVGILDGANLAVRVGAAGNVSRAARESGKTAARLALRDLPLTPADRSRAMLLFADTQTCDGAEVLHGALGVAGAGVAWCGGGTGDLEGGTASVQFCEGRVLRDHVVAITIDCPARVGVGIQHGWEPTGPPAMVTCAAGCSISRLEHRPAFEIYQAAARDRGLDVDMARFARFAVTHPLGIPQADGEYLIRDPLSVDEDGALHFLATVPDGALVRVMEGTPEMLVEASRVAASMAVADADGELGGALVFDCVSRYLMLGERLGEELAVCQDALGADVPLLGCLTFGEYGAFGARMPQFHNKTVVVLGFPA